MKIMTGQGGYDLLQIALESNLGFSRLYAPSKLIRILKNRFNKIDYKGRKYTLIWTDTLGRRKVI